MSGPDVDGASDGSQPTLADDAAVREDTFLDGRLRVFQPVRGYRSGTDAVLLAALAPVPVDAPSHVLDAGAGVGVVGLMIATRHPCAKLALIEREPILAALARENVARNDLAARCQVVEGDITAFPAGLLADGSFTNLVANPPFAIRGHGQTPEHPIRAAAHVMEPGDLAAWARFLARMAAPDAHLTLIHRADHLANILSVLEGRFGALKVLPVQSFDGVPANRVVVSGIKGSRAPLTLLPALVLHNADRGFAAPVEAAMRDGAALRPPGWQERA